MCSSNSESYCISERGKSYINLKKPMSPITKLANAGNNEYNLARYDKETNPKGLIHLGLSENKVVDDLVVPRVSQRLKIESEDIRYFPFEGSLRFRKLLSKFFDRYMKPAAPIDPDDIFVVNGCAALGQCLANILCDPGDGILLPAPYYYSYDEDFVLQPKAVCYPVNLSSKGDPEDTQSYELTVEKLQAALDKAKKENVRIRALVMCHPHNPLGVVYSKELVQQCLEFAQRHSLHVISDEIYMLTVYGDCQWVSAASFQNVIDPNLLHIMYGFSKDFGLSGIRVGVLLSRNRGVIEAMKAISYYHAVPPVIQILLTSAILDIHGYARYVRKTVLTKSFRTCWANIIIELLTNNSLEGLIDDYEWLENTFLPTLHKRLRNCLATVSKGLHDLNVPIVNPLAGLYVWANFSHHLQPPSSENEKALNEMFQKNGVSITPGWTCASSEPGWFRLVFASDLAVLKTALERIAATLQSFSKSADNTVSHVVPCTDSASLEDLVSQLKVQIGQSDWLKENTAEKWVAENPQLAKEFMDGKNSST